MKASLNWIREYVELPAELTVERLAFDLTMRTVEVEGYENLAKSLRNIVAARIVSVEPHPQADRLRVVICDAGEGEPVQVVCGGSNLAPGQMVVLARPGAKVVWHGEGEPVEIKASKLRGVASAGMICAAGEIGLDVLFPADDDHEIIDLRGIACLPGESIADVLQLDDEILEIDNKSMTNRPDLWGHYGLARELSAIYGCALKPLPVYMPDPSMPTYPVEIENGDLCRRYAAIVFSNLKNEASPLWLQSSLLKVGQRPINNIVDITNYIMLAVGQPTHGFDKNHVRGGIRVRVGRENEVLELLDGKKLDLSGQNLVIADHGIPLGLAGIMGGKQDSVLPETTEIVLELANFSPTSIRRTTQAFGLRTEASARFDKHIDTQRIDPAIGLAVKLFSDIIPGSYITAYHDVCPQPTPLPIIEVTLDFLSRRLGSAVTVADIAKSLVPLGFQIDSNGGNLRITTPSWRGTGDVSLPDDILEEVARMIGYANFEYHAPTITLDRPINQREIQLDRNLREYLAFRCGFQEIFTYPWVDDRFLQAASINRDDLLNLATPPAPETSSLRSSLVPGLLEAIGTNLRYFDTFKVFELTQVFRKGSMSPSVPEEVLPQQERFLAGTLVGSNAEQLFFEAKGILEAMARCCQMKELAFCREQEPAWAEKKVWLNITAGGEIIGALGLLSLKAKKAAGIKRAQAVIFELNVEKLSPLFSRTNAFKHLPLFPLVDQDLSVLLDESVQWSEIEAQVKPLVKELSFVEEYRGKQVPSGKKSLMFRVRLGSDEATLTADQIESKMAAIVKRLNKLGGEVRSV